MWSFKEIKQNYHYPKIDALILAKLVPLMEEHIYSVMGILDT